MPSRPAIASLRDVESIERIPLAERGLPNSTYELIRRTARAHSNATAIELLPSVESTSTIRISYGDFVTAINRTGHLLRQLGVNTHTAVTLLLPSLPQGHFTIWGAQAVGIANPVNPLFKASQIASIMRFANARVLVSLGPRSPGDLWKKACDAV